MSLDNLVNNIKKVNNVLRVDGLLALVRIFHYKLVMTIHWKLGKLFPRSAPDNTQIMGQRKIAIFTSASFNDIDAGQRAIHLAWAGLRTGIQVLFVYALPKQEDNKQINTVSRNKLPHLLQRNINELTLQEFLKFINNKTTININIPDPLFLDYFKIAQIRGIHTVFELNRDWREELGGAWLDENILQRFVLGADVTIGTSRVLTNILFEMGRTDAVYLPNAANEYIFEINQQYKKPSDLPDGQIALYTGSMDGDWFGWEYLIEAAIKNSDICFCQTGTKPAKIPSPLPQNVYFLGEKKVEELPPYLNNSVFCILPVRSSNSTDAISPMAAFEYLFMAKPVVSTNITEINGFPLVFTASDEHEFASLCQTMKDLIDRDGVDRRKIDEFISHNSWFSRLHQIINLKGQQNVSVVILIHNNRQIIGRCLQSLFENCSSYLADVVVVDNASDDGGDEYVSENFPLARLIRNPVNGCSSGRNLGAKFSNGKYLAFFDSDQWFTSGFCFEEALSIFRSHADIGAVGWAGGWFMLDGEDLVGPVVDYFPNRARNAETSIKGFRTDVPYLSTAGLFVPRTIFEAAGGFDTAYDPTSFEDTDLSFAIKKIGFKIAYRDLTGIQHEAHQTTKSHEKSTEYREVFSRNSKYLSNKWSNYRHFFSEKKNWMF